MNVMMETMSVCEEKDEYDAKAERDEDAEVENIGELEEEIFGWHGRNQDGVNVQLSSSADSRF